MAKVHEFMTTEVATVDRSARLEDAAKLMRDRDIGFLAVVENGSVRGVVTDRDIVIRGLAEGKATGQVGDVITGKVVSLSPDDDAKDAEKMMSENDVRRLPVLDNGRLVGIVSVGDLAVRTDDKLAGKVMEQTGPKKN